MVSRILNQPAAAVVAVPRLMILVVLLLNLSAAAADAGTGEAVIAPPPGQPDLGLTAASAVLVETTTGQVLYARDPSQPVGPASLAKIMTLLLAFEDLAAGRVTPETTFTVSEQAWSARVPGSKMFIEVGREVTVEDLLKGIAISSGNDASLAMAEGLAGSEAAFVTRMNARAQELGMKDTVFKNSHGLPAEGQVTTAADMALLAGAFVQEHPEALSLMSTRSYTYNGITQENRNGLLGRDSRVNGLKTGHTEESGFHLVATARSDNMNLAAVVLGVKAPSEAEGFRLREDEVRKLLDYGFTNFVTVEPDWRPEAGEEARVWKGKKKTVAFAPVVKPLVTVSREAADRLQVEVRLDSPLVAPIEQGQKVGTMELSAEPGFRRSFDLTATEPVARGGFFRVVWDSIRLLLAGVPSRR